MKRKILSQGDMDSACYLYSVSNAYFALTNNYQLSREDKYEKWDAAIKVVPFLEDFLRASEGEGTTRYLDDQSFFATTIHWMLEEMSTNKPEMRRFHVEACPEVTTGKQLAPIIDDNTIAIICPKGKHWLVAVGVENSPNRILCACSWEHASGRNYTENRDKKTRRYWNAAIGFREKFDFAILVSLR